MSNLHAMLMALGNGAPPAVAANTLFVPVQYTGTGASESVSTGSGLDIALSIYGGAVWLKARGSTTSGHGIFHTARGANQRLTVNTTAANVADSSSLTSFNDGSFTVGTQASRFNTLDALYEAWVFRNAANFYTHSVVVKSAGVSPTVDLSTLGVVGMVRVKRTDSTGTWHVWHKSLTAGNLLFQETTAAQAANGSITVVGTTLTLVNAVIADGTYLVEAWAADKPNVQCLSWTGTGSAQSINCGFSSAARFVLARRVDATDNWRMFDSVMGYAGSTDPVFFANTAAAIVEDTDYLSTNAAGFGVTSSLSASGGVYIGLAIR